LRVVFDLTCQIRERPPLPVNAIQNSEAKRVRILRLDPHLAKRAMRFMRCPGNDLMIEQLQMFPDKGYHDDGPDALQMASRLWQRYITGCRVRPVRLAV
jgi:predicted phage terminase large subunit-like protein